MPIDSLQELFFHQIRSLYDSEMRLLSNLRRMANMASSRNLRWALAKSYRETQEHIARLDMIFRHLGESPRRRNQSFNRRLFARGNLSLATKTRGEVKDAAITASVRRLEHHEIACYGAARSMARKLGFEWVHAILTLTLEEKGEADIVLSEISAGKGNVAFDPSISERSRKRYAAPVSPKWEESLLGRLSS
jgi:ferritin-like metal-binding protein YciE